MSVVNDRVSRKSAGYGVVNRPYPGFWGDRGGDERVRSAFVLIALAPTRATGRARIVRKGARCFGLGTIPAMSLGARMRCEDGSQRVICAGW